MDNDRLTDILIKISSDISSIQTDIAAGKDSLDKVSNRQGVYENKVDVLSHALTSHIGKIRGVGIFLGLLLAVFGLIHKYI